MSLWLPFVSAEPKVPALGGSFPTVARKVGTRGTSATGLLESWTSFMDLFVVVGRKEGKCDGKPTSRVRAPGAPCPEVLHPLAWSGQPVAALARKQRTGRVSEGPRLAALLMKASGPTTRPLQHAQLLVPETDL